MFKFAHKISSYRDESRIDFNLSKRKRNFRFKDKVLYLKDQTVLWKNDAKFWYKFLYVMNDKIYTKIGLYYLKNNILNRDFDKPAIIKSNGDKLWYLNGKIHREGGLPAIICSNGNKYWYFNGKLHRDDGLPAIDTLYGEKAWYLNGILHREGGLPAYIDSNGSKQWYLNGVQYTP